MTQEIIIKDVRCFAGKQRFNVRPLTFLIGENSTGKSTILGCVQTVANAISAEINFNTEPYRMGSFSEICRRASKSTHTRSAFLLGFTTEKFYGEAVDVLLEFREAGSEPIVSSITLQFSKGGKIVFLVSEKKNMHFVTNIEQQSKNSFTIALDSLDRQIRIIDFILRDILVDFLRDAQEQNPVERALAQFLFEKTAQTKDTLLSVWRSKKNRFFYKVLFYEMLNTISMAPIRSKPQRTYDPVSETQTPEGSDVPMYLMRLERTDATELKSIQKQLAKFGRASGLFRAVSVRTYGTGMNEPFQLQIKIRDTQYDNIVDVGYGVSQVLPILVRILSKHDSTMLLQQPEVHLHPRGQAELASQFISAIKERKQGFIIETHSDYMIDRARIEIRAGRIKCEDVSLIYLEPNGNRVNVHNISFDEVGNMRNVPSTYRKFFLRESESLLGIEDINHVSNY